MIIECSNCEAKVDAKFIAEYVILSKDDYSDPYKVCLLSCPSCKSAILGGCNEIQIGPDELGWDDQPERLWPDPVRFYSPSISPLVLKSIEEAQRCYQAKAYSAAAVMCGRALEAICKEKTGEKTLYAGLKKLKEKNEIDERLFEWGDVLRKERNIGAHASNEITSKQDARDILDFAISICEYIYVLSEKYKDFLKRKEKA